MRNTVLLAILLLAGLGAGGVMVLQSRQSAVTDKAPAAATTAPTELASKAPAGPENPNVVVSRAPLRTVEQPYYVIHDTGNDLVLSKRTETYKVAGRPSMWRQAHIGLSAIERFHTDGAYQSPMPEGAKVLGVHIDLNGIATINMSPEFQSHFNGGAREEQVTIYALVNTVGHVEGVRGVKFEIAGKPIDEFAGHLDLGDPLTPDDSLVEKS